MHYILYEICVWKQLPNNDALTLFAPRAVSEICDRVLARESSVVPCSLARVAFDKYDKSDAWDNIMYFYDVPVVHQPIVSVSLRILRCYANPSVDTYAIHPKIYRTTGPVLLDLATRVEIFSKRSLCTEDCKIRDRLSSHLWKSKTKSLDYSLEDISYFEDALHSHFRSKVSSIKISVLRDVTKIRKKLNVLKIFNFFWVTVKIWNSRILEWLISHMCLKINECSNLERPEVRITRSIGMAINSKTRQFFENTRNFGNLVIF